MKKLLTGNEGVARGAYEAGVVYAAAYPGTPSTEILETIGNYKGDIIAEWAPNEKVAVECAIGASLAGGRAITAMKMVGLNVAADPFFSGSYAGVNGGLVVVDADDPGVGAVRHARIQVQLVGKFQAVVDVLCFTADVFGGAVMLDAAPDSGGEVLGKQCGKFGLGFYHGVMVRHKRSPESRCAAFAVR